MSLQLPLILLVGVLVAAVATGAYVIVVSRQRREILVRVEGAATPQPASALLRPAEKSAGAQLAQWVAERAPESWSDGEKNREKLIHAGFDGPASVALLAAVRVIFGVLFPAVVFVWVSGHSSRDLLMYVGLAAAVGVLGPPAVLDRIVQRRQARLRRAVPDALDLLVVCVEAGVSLDAAILRVARDLNVTHPSWLGN
jgi:tight adherence protein C